MMETRKANRPYGRSGSRTDHHPLRCHAAEQAGAVGWPAPPVRREERALAKDQSCAPERGMSRSVGRGGETSRERARGLTSITHGPLPVDVQWADVDQAPEAIRHRHGRREPLDPVLDVLGRHTGELP